ncbi:MULTISPECIES: porin [unclassified Paraburkholderia]|uniref:porin n=1 Tax=unclassified Paraburkholderia TaxID=2615204 RepID=UPI0020B7F952|nr:MULTISPECIES: porin [unclassified Paraburkholderia]MCP3717737.1 porin [Paraburkholderia sp. CNPSo 3281]MCX5540485.1 porin [Paraburkholderia sp. CNPSo 3076]
MKRVALSTLSLALLAAAGTAHAQSSVTLYGVIDESIQYVNHTMNSQGQNKNLVALVGGNLQGNRWGLKGTEDLGGGLKAIFQLESGFDINSGKMGKYNGNTAIFGRQAFVGLSHDQYGTVTFGRQYDPVVDMVQPLTGDNYFGSTFATPGDVDNNDNSSRTNSAVKYVSPVLQGFQFEGMYAFGGVAGSTGSGQTWGAAATYGIGSFNVAGGYVRMDNASSPASRAANGGWASGATSDAMFQDGSQITQAYASAKSVGIASVAAQYVAGPFTFNGRYSNVQMRRDSASAFPSNQRFNVAGGYLGYQLNPALLLGLGYTWTHGSGDTSNTYNQVSLGADYNLSKRTDLYAVAAWQHANGTQRDSATTTSIAGASIGSYGYNSATSSQTMVSLGIRHKF